MSNEGSGKIIFSLDGMQYGIDILNMTNREIDTACQLAKVDGYLHLAQGMQALSPKVICALCCAAMKRSGVDKPDFEKLMDLNMGDIEVAVDDSEDPTQEDAEDGNPSSQESME